MKKIIISFSFLICISSLSCLEKSEVKKLEEKSHQSLEKDFSKWWNYHSENIHLSTPFISLDIDRNQIPTSDFLSELKSGNFIAIKLENDGTMEKYQLFDLSEEADSDIRKTIINISKKALAKNKLMYTDFPNFSFTDLDGNSYDNESTIGKIVVLKCWFINCKPCVKEFPLLNEYVIKNKREDILFVSLAIDDEIELREFLNRKEFKYATVPKQEQFMETKLGINDYPTHIIINRDGLYSHISNNAEEMIAYLELILRQEELAPPPPPM